MITAKVADGRNARVVSALEMPAGVPGAGRVDAPFLAAARRTAKNGPSGTAANFARGALDRLALAVDARAADSRGADCVRCGAGLLGEFEVPVRAVERAWTRSAGDAVQRPMAALAAPGLVGQRCLRQAGAAHVQRHVARAAVALGVAVEDAVVAVRVGQAAGTAKVARGVATALVRVRGPPPAVRRAVVCEPERKGPRSGADC
mmetsp:Transcript_5790/g.20643  ORF Transcript_5790/g.20643 Transcript_5790/m.20643 type:complete len:204 (+) Transcript_5790:1846-2457(+)